MTARQAPVEVMQALCEAFNEWDSCLDGGERRNLIWREKVAPALSAYRAAIAPLRTRLTLEERVARLERATEYAPYQGKLEVLRGIRDDLLEPTADPAPEADPLPDPEACGCEEAEHLKRELERFRAELDKTRIESAQRAAKLSDIANHAQGGTGKSAHPYCMGETACREILRIARAEKYP